jgi:hypothetical protein
MLVITGLFAAHQPALSERREAMNNALTAIVIVVGGTSLICLLVSQIQNRRGRGRSRDGTGSDGGYYAGNDSASPFGWTGTHHSSSDHAASDHSGGSDSAGSSGDSGGGDSGGGGDGGGGGGGGD